MTKCSVILATYNGKDYLLETLRSIRDQTFKDIELICVDDCSEDSTVQVLNQFASEHRDINISIIESVQNQGLVQTFLKGVAYSSGQYISLFGQDDIMLPNRLKCLVDTIERTSMSMVCSNAYFLYGKQPSSKLVRPTQRRSGRIRRFKFYHTNPIIGPSVLFEKNSFKDIDHGDIFRFRQSMEWIHWFQYVDMKGIYYIREPLLYYRRHDQNLSSQVFESPEFLAYKNYCREKIGSKLSFSEKWLSYIYFMTHRAYTKLSNPSPNRKIK